MSFFYGASSMSTFLSPYQIGGGAGAGTPATEYFPVTWQNMVLVTQSGADNKLTRDSPSGSHGSWNAGASSVESIAGDGYMETTATDYPTTVSRIISFSQTDNNTGTSFWADAEFGIGLYATGNAWVVEGGGNDILDLGTFALGDVFKVARIGTVVKYYKNGFLVYTSLSASTGTLHVDVVITHDAGTVGGVRLVDTTGWVDPGPTFITHTNIVAGAVASGIFTKSGGAGWNSGFSSVESIVGDGYIQWTATEANLGKMVGLSTSDPDQDYSTEEHAIYTYGASNVQIYESGILRVDNVDTYVPNTTVFRISRVGGFLYYYRNGAHMRTVPETLTPLFVDVTVEDNGGTVGPIEIST